MTEIDDYVCCLKSKRKILQEVIGELIEAKRAGQSRSFMFLASPGSGKTYTGARLIVSLIAAGKRVGVSALSHKAINNLLTEVEKVAVAEGVTFRGLKKGEGDTQDQRWPRNQTRIGRC